MDLEKMKDCFNRCNDLFLNELTTEEKISGLLDMSEYERGSILVPFVFDHDEPHFLFTIRNQLVAMYPGEISFPGGRSEDIDSSPVETALREAREEINLSPEDVKIIGSFDDACVVRRETNNRLRNRVYVLSIVIGLISDITNLIANKDEVDEIFLLPLKDLFSNLRMMSYELPKLGEKRLPTIMVEKERKTVTILGFSATIAILVCSILNLVPMGSIRKVQVVLEERINTFRNSPGLNWLLNSAIRECKGHFEEKAVKPKL